MAGGELAEPAHGGLRVGEIRGPALACEHRLSDSEPRIFLVATPAGGVGGIVRWGVDCLQVGTVSDPHAEVERVPAEVGVVHQLLQRPVDRIADQIEPVYDDVDAAFVTCCEHVQIAILDLEVPRVERPCESR